MSLKDIFAELPGCEVSMIEEEKEITIFGQKETYTSVRPTEETVGILTNMQEKLEAAGYRLRAWWPGRAGTDDVQNNRVNVDIEKADDGKWYIGSDFRLG